MNLGRTIRDARERRGWTADHLALMAAVSPSWLSRVEHGSANPSWTKVQRLADALGFDAEIRLVPKIDEVQALATRIRAETPADRLFRQPAVVYDALMRLAASEVSYVVGGSVAALLQGLPCPIHGLEIAVRDDEESLLALEELLLNEYLLFAEQGTAWMRANAAKVWAIGNVGVTVSLTAPLPAALPILVDGQAIPVAPLDLLMADPEVAALVARLGSGRSEDCASMTKTSSEECS